MKRRRAAASRLDFGVTASIWLRFCTAGHLVTSRGWVCRRPLRQEVESLWDRIYFEACGEGYNTWRGTNGFPRSTPSDDARPELSADLNRAGYASWMQEWCE